MWILILGLVIFFAVHLVRVVAPGYRAAQVVANEGRWKGIYSLASLVGLVLIVWGWIVYRGEAPQVFDPPDWGRWANIVLSVVAFCLLPAAYQPAGYIRTTLKHPFLTAVILWALGHMLANGDLASLLLFGAFLAYGVIDRIAVIPRGDPAPVFVSARGDVVSVAAGLVISAVLVFWLHGVLFGASPLV